MLNYTMVYVALTTWLGGSTVAQFEAILQRDISLVSANVLLMVSILSLLLSLVFLSCRLSVQQFIASSLCFVLFFAYYRPSTYSLLLHHHPYPTLLPTLSPPCLPSPSRAMPPMRLVGRYVIFFFFTPHGLSGKIMIRSSEEARRLHRRRLHRPGRNEMHASAAGASFTEGDLPDAMEDPKNTAEIAALERVVYAALPRLHQLASHRQPIDVALALHREGFTVEILQSAIRNQLDLDSALNVPALKLRSGDRLALATVAKSMLSTTVNEDEAVSRGRGQRGRQRFRVPAVHS